MIEKEDIPTFFRDLYYIIEQELEILKGAKIPAKIKERIKDNLIEKQTIIARMISLFLNVENEKN